MNKIRRKELNEIVSEIQVAKEKLEIILSEEEECRDNIPENLQQSENYEIIENTCFLLQDAVDNLDNAINNIIESTE